MHYKLIGENNILNPITQVLKNRGVKDATSYLALDAKSIQEYTALDNIDKAINCFLQHYNHGDTISILADEDTDGFTSASMMYLYIKKLNADYPVYYVLHKQNKSHGLAAQDFELPQNTTLFIIPDAATNDSTLCNQFIDNGTDILILDHHIGENYKSNKAIIVNNQLSEQYHNKNLCGAGIVYRFLQALDSELWVEYADDFLDLCAVGNIADIMDLREPETRYIVNSGLQNGFKNKFLQALFNAQEFSTQGILNIHNVAWYIAPVINAVIRTGTVEEKNLLFKALIEQDACFDYKKRNGDIVQETIYERAARIAKNAKSRQDNAKKKLITHLENKINANDNIIIQVCDTEEDGLLGLGAMSLADKYSKPTILLKQREVNGKQVYSGSIRNFNNSPIQDFRQFLLDTNTANFVSGHGNAAGIEFDASNFEQCVRTIETVASSINMTPMFYIDFQVNVDDIDSVFVNQIDNAKWIWCTGISEPLFLVTNIDVVRKDIEVMGKEHNSIAFYVNDIKYVQFKISDGNAIYDFLNDWEQDDHDTLSINAIGKYNMNYYNGVYTPQFIIEDCERI